MRTDDPVLWAVAAANPVRIDGEAPAAERARHEALLRRVIAQPAPRRRFARPVGGAVVPALSAAVVVLVAGVFLLLGGRGGRPAVRATGQPGRSITLQLLPTAGSPRVVPALVKREARLLAVRLDALSGAARVTIIGRDRLAVTVGPELATSGAGLLVWIDRSAVLGVYDWEADVLAPDGHPVASQLVRPGAVARGISQGGSLGPGGPGTGSLSLHEAVALASRQAPAPAGRMLSRPGGQVYLFGTPDSSACVAVARTERPGPGTDRHCLLAGPVDVPASARPAAVMQHLLADRRPGVSRAAAQRARPLSVPAGVIVAEAVGRTPFDALTARFYVLRDRPALTDRGLADPLIGHDNAGQASVTTSWAAGGFSRFRTLTAQVAHRGAEVSVGGNRLDQHVAIVLTGPRPRIVSVVFVDYTVYPDGILSARPGLQIIGSPTHANAQGLVDLLRSAHLPLGLRLAG